MAEAVILSAIESLDCWLLKKGGILDENLEKLYSLIVGMSDLGDEKKEMVHRLLLQLQMEKDEDEDEDDEEDEDEDEDEDEEEVERIKKKLYNLLDLNKEKMYSLVVGMVDFWELDYKERIYCLLFRLTEGVDNLVLIAEDSWGVTMTGVNQEKVQSMVVEIVDLWEDDEGKLNINDVLFQMQYRYKWIDGNQIVFLKKNMRRVSGEVARLWKDKKPKLNKEKLYTWLANKENLFLVLLDMVLLYDSSDFRISHRNCEKENIEAVEGAKRELGEILDLITDNKLGEENSLRYFISDAVDMAHHAHFLVQLMDSDPFALFFELYVLLQGFEYYETYQEWFGKKFVRIVNGLQEIKVSMLGFRAERLQNGREMEGGENVVGLEDDVTSVLVKLKLLQLHRDIITVIKGMAGIGKTTLARQVYNHTDITQKFERRAWVCLSKVFSRKEMLVFLIRQLADSSELALLEKIECADYKSLKQVLRQQLLGMRYFIVIDDVSYETTHLKYVQKALPDDTQGSRLLLTTRDASRERILHYPFEEKTIHMMKFMDADRSWKLLLKTLFIEGSVEEFPKPLVKKAREILTKCGGLPLAIKEVGRNWAKKRQIGSEWEKLIESINLTETLRTLETVYNDWNPQLQSRFLHLAFFKEGAPIRAKRLVHIWIVMGVVSDIKEEYQDNLYELLRESVIDIERDVNFNIKTCCVHTVFHMLSIKLAEDELKFEILRKDGNNRHSHHRAIYCSREKLMKNSSDRDKHLVSLFLYGGGYFNASLSYWKHFEQLETLDMEDFGLKILPDVIGMLSELRYLGLRNNYIQELPHSLSRLKNLEVLDIALNFMVEVEDIIWEMESLRHLYMSDISCRKPLRIDTLKNLETWTYVSVHNWTYEASRLEMMTSLTKLGIQEVDGKRDTLFASLAQLINLKSLILRGFHFKSMPSLDEIGDLQKLHELKLDGLITRLPSADKFPTYIQSLSLVNSCLCEDPMPILERLFYLSYLKLQNAYTGQQMVISHGGFDSLLCLVMEELMHLTNVQIEESAMKLLDVLEINNCPNLETLPEKDYYRMNTAMFKMRTTKKNASKIRESSFASKFREFDIQP